MIKILLSDSMEQIQAKLLKGGDIQFEKGTYKITKQLHLYSNTYIDMTVAKLLRNADIQSVFITHIDKDTTGYNGQHDITIHGGIIENMGQYYADNIIEIIHCKRIIIDGVTFVDGSMHDIECNGACDVTIKNCTFKGHYTKDKEHSYAECIQYDMSLFSGFVLKGTKPTDKMYDGTCCKNITVENNTFVKGYRGGINCCVGQHCQGNYRGKSLKHENIIIRNNKMSGFGGNEASIGVRLFGVKNAVIEDNLIEGFGRAVSIQNADYSYNEHGEKIDAKEGDGISENISIIGNSIKPLDTFEISGVFVMSKTQGEHKNIFKKNNKIVE